MGIKFSKMRTITFLNNCQQYALVKSLHTG